MWVDASGRAGRLLTGTKNFANEAKLVFAVNGFGSPF